MKVNEMRESLEFYREKFEELLGKIKDHESGSSEYSNDQLDEMTDDLHEEICATVDLIVRRIINNYNDYGRKVLNLRYVKQLAPIVESLYLLAGDCTDLCEYSEKFGLKYTYGNGCIDAIGCDFNFPKTEEFDYLYYTPSFAYEYLLTYGLVEDYR